jgi:hypothetical protein
MGRRIGRASWYLAVAITLVGSALFVVGIAVGASNLAATGFGIAFLSASAIGAWFCGVFMLDASRATRRTHSPRT